MRRTLAWGFIGIVAFLACCVIGYRGWISYLRWQEVRSPSTEQIVALPNGQQILLIQPTQAPPPTQVVPTQAISAQSMPTPVVVEQAAPTATPAPPVLVLPPERLRIPKIAVDRPVVLSDNDNLPGFPGVGWMIGSAFPGAAGNMVLYGHLGGANGVFQRLHELQPGDQFSVTTQEGDRNYQVEKTFETTPDDVSVLLPSSGSIATLITCSGPWNAALQTNERRLIVMARLIDGVAP